MDGFKWIAFYLLFVSSAALVTYLLILHLPTFYFGAAMIIVTIGNIAMSIAIIVKLAPAMTNDRIMRLLKNAILKKFSSKEGDCDQ